MEILKKIKELEKSKEFLEWKKSNEKSYLVHVFRMFDDENKDVWQIGYYNENDTITTFFLDSYGVKEIPEQNIFKKDKKKVPRLVLKNVKIEFEDALEIANKIHSERYSNHPVLKLFAILQKIGEEQVFNITYVTQTFNTLNIRVDSSSREIKKEELTSLMDIAKFDEGKKSSSEDSDKNYIR
jgi:hypothetical protein